MDKIDIYVKGVMISDGSHDYAIPESLYNEHKDFITDCDEDDVEDCEKWNFLFSDYRVEGKFEFYIKLKQ